MNYVFVVDVNRVPCMPCHPARARELLTKRKAAVLRRYPFTIILKHAVTPDPQPLSVNIDPGSKTTGMAMTNGRVRFLVAGKITTTHIRNCKRIHRDDGYKYE